MDDVERVINYLNDLDQEWWPFLFLRPPPAEKIGTSRAAALATLYGVFVGMLANALLALQGKPIGLLPLPVSATCILFVLYRFVFAFFWNRRAARLQNGMRLSKSNPSLR